MHVKISYLVVGANVWHGMDFFCNMFGWSEIAEGSGEKKSIQNIYT